MSRPETRGIKFVRVCSSGRYNDSRRPQRSPAGASRLRLNAHCAVVSSTDVDPTDLSLVPGPDFGWHCGPGSANAPLDVRFHDAWRMTAVGRVPPDRMVPKAEVHVARLRSVTWQHSRHLKVPLGLHLAESGLLGFAATDCGTHHAKTYQQHRVGFRLRNWRSCSQIFPRTGGYRNAVWQP